ncbi:PREDICTED: nucleotide exchange factor SIL1 [Nelumbo nucifera]|uniref:Nucleotide exchange factor SIL1 n=1 Tax=Nelumbo nucifera TaxID=4432 RepID=A0A1U7ZA79_NELNU|nr:PREDICTED: nucleotide exchange factor SIL1 [Nelumbo nucifera]
MWPKQKRLALWFLLLASAAALAATFTATARADGINKSAVGELFWATAKQEDDLLRKAAADESAIAGNDEGKKNDNNDGDHDLEFDGGFSSLDSMLQWAIGHSDPMKMKETAQDVQRLSPNELKKRQLEIKELMEKLRTPSDAKLMQIAIDDLKNSSLPLEDRHRALLELLILVEPIDNANDLGKLGGLAVVVQELDNPDSEIRATAAWVLGKASQNNPAVQNQILGLGTLAKLVKMVRSSSLEEATKALYAVSALIRSNTGGQELFYAETGSLMLQDIMSNPSIDVRLRRKSASLVADLAGYQLEITNKAEHPFFSNHFFLKSVVDLTASTDLDLQEKALMAIKNLLQLQTPEALVFKDICGLDEALERMRKQLEQLMVGEDQTDYARDLESLRKEVEWIFLRKLEKAQSST